MYQSKLFTKTRKEAPKDEVSKNAELLIKAGFINKEMAGVYDYLPLGLKVLNNINNIIREEMNKLGGQEVFLTSLQEKEIWSKTDRWDDDKIDVWLKTKLKNETVLGLAFTHEEALTNLMKNHIRSYKDLPVYPYQIQTKFRNETRAKSGIMRCREFLMKDMYSFSKDVAEHEAFYERAKSAYVRIFERVGLGDKTYITFASGGSFCKYSHEFQTVSPAGEDTIYICEKCKVAINDEIIKEQDKCPICGNQDLTVQTSIEVGNIFSLGTKFSDALDLTYIDEKGEKKKVIMGSYGIGPGRLLGTIVESLSDKDGIIWPPAVAPFYVHIIELSSENPEVRKTAERIYAEIKAKNIEVLFDDRDLRAGEKLKDSDLIGIPVRIVISDKTLASGKYEVKRRKESESILLSEEDLWKELLK